MADKGSSSTMISMTSETTTPMIETASPIIVMADHLEGTNCITILNDNELKCNVWGCKIAISRFYSICCNLVVIYDGEN